MLRETAEGLTLTLFTGFPLAVWDAFWLVTAHNTEQYREVFRALYHLKIGTIDDGGSDVAAILIEDGFLPWWVSAALFIASPGGACLDGCEQSQRPTP